MEKEFRKILKEIRSLSMVDDIYWRASYTKEDTLTKAYLIELMKSKGIDAYLDEVGNVIGKVKGREDRTIAIGSHVDTVRNGGEFDGMYGVLCGIFAVEKFIEKYGEPKCNIIIAGFVEEEGSRFLSGYIGSRAVVGLIKEDDLQEVDKDNISLSDAMEAVGLETKSISNAIWKDVEAFFEIHIEQGPILENAKKAIGLNTSITGIKVMKIKIFGRQDHAGTTPMDVRKDALKQACNLITNLYNQETWHEYYTITVGEMDVKPGSSNVVPSEVAFSVDIRSGNQQILDSIHSFIEEKLKTIESCGFPVEYLVEVDEEPVMLDEKLLLELQEVLNESDDYMIMTSGAGHDSQIIAPIIPTALIFIPCVNGRSHTPQEAVEDTFITKGIETMFKVLEKKAR